MEITKIETNYKRKLFFCKSKVSFKKYQEKIENQVINIYPEITYQTFLGFGGAFTEATGYAIKQLSQEKQNQVLNDYFSKDGLNYSLGRLPIGSTDFSPKSYSYSYKEDLSDFSIEKDKEYILPIVKSALEINPNLQFLSSPWSPPKFMKSNKMLVLGGKLIEKYKKTMANYFAKYLTAYKNEGIDIKYVTVQNEPNAIQVWESCLYNSEEEMAFATNYLYPTLRSNNIQTKILIWDHNKEKLFTRSKQELINNKALEAISGIAYHYYSGDHFENITLTHAAFPGKILLHTEGCTGYSKFNPNEEVQNGEIYGHDILGDLNAGSNGYIDWNLVLDNRGGPNHKLNYCNSPIMINSNKTDYIKNLTYYYIGHFSKFIMPGSKRIAFSKYTSDIEVTAFKNPDNSIAIVLMNRNNFNKEYTICLNDVTFHDNLNSHAIVSYVIKN